jgi:hypothetical protein
MSLKAVLALLAIIAGLVALFADSGFFAPPLVWFVLAIALNTLGLDYSLGGKRA